MRALAGLPDAAVHTLLVATNIPGPSPAQKIAPNFWRWFGDVVAREVGIRHGMDDLEEPAMPALDAHELEAAGVVLVAMAGTLSRPAKGEEDAEADTLLAAALFEIAYDLVTILRDRAAAAGPGN